MLTQTDMRFFYFIPILDEKLYPARLPYETHTKRDTNAYGVREHLIPTVLPALLLLPTAFLILALKIRDHRATNIRATKTYA